MKHVYGKRMMKKLKLLLLALFAWIGALLLPVTSAAADNAEGTSCEDIDLLHVSGSGKQSARLKHSDLI
jgi:uncharacterized protein YggE